MSDSKRESVSSQRLEKMFTSSRDLTLQNRRKQRTQPPNTTFTPNLSVTRKKNDAKAIAASKEKEVKESKDQNQRNKDAKNKKNVNANKFVQSQDSIFSQGIAVHQQRRTHEARDTSGDNTIPRPKINNKIEAERITKSDLDKEHLVLSNLIGLDAEDEDMKFKEDASHMHPVKINRNANKKLRKADPVKDELPENGKVKAEPSDNFEMSVESDFRDLDLSCRGGSIAQDKKLFAPNSRDLMIFQLPDTLPGRLLDKDEEPIPSEQQQPTSAQKSAKPNLCSLESIDEGLIGKIVRYKSGKTKLILGDSIYNIQRGLASDFNQNVITHTTNEQERSGTFYNLGPIEAKFTVSPDWNWLFQKL